MQLVVIDLVSASKLKKDFVKYSNDELEKLSGKKCDAYVESLVVELMKSFKNGAIVENPDATEINDLINSYMEFANRKFNNAETVLLDRKFKYLMNAYFTANVNALNHVLDLKTTLLTEMVSNLIQYILELDKLLLIYHDNYSNYSMINELFFNLSTVDDLDLTFNIHQKYLDNEFGVNSGLMRDLNYFIESIVEKIFELFDKVESLYNVAEISADDYFDKNVAVVKSCLKETLSDITDFDRTALINSGYDTALFHQIEVTEIEINMINMYLKYKDKFMNLYNDNGFAEVSADIFKSLNKIYPENFDDFDDFMNKEPKYDLQNFKLIEPDDNKIAF